MSEWKTTTIRPRPNSMYQFERIGHRLGYDKRVSITTGRTQYRPRCMTGDCKWKSTVWYKARNDATRREFVSHVKSIPAQGSLLTGDKSV